ncbi:LysR family transcriptional regulator [Glaciibacter flavus]|uniref:LysR family transcriptional regulator n=1 Tax=Orlajensenia flava TaxID=2565934 RepID=UPI003B00782D
MDITMLRHYVAVATDLDLGRAASTLGVSQAVVSGSLNQLEATVGEQLIDRSSATLVVTDAGTLFLVTARAEVAAHDAANTPRPPKTGGKAKASKGKGRAPRVKGEPLPFKKRQSR